MTPFQTHCADRVRGWLSERGLTTEFEEVHGQKEDYLRGVVAHPHRPVEVFIYADEAGVMRSDKQWKVCERWDFSSEEELVARLLELIAEELNPPPT